MRARRLVGYTAVSALAVLILLSSPWEGEARRRALDAVGGAFAWPAPIITDGNWAIGDNGAGGNWGIYTSGTPRYMAWMVQAPKDGTLDMAEWQWGRVYSAFTTLRVSFQDIDASGNPDGTQDQFRDISSGSQVSSTWIAPGLMTSDGTDGGTKRTVSQGDLFAVVLEIESGTGELYGANIKNSQTQNEINGDYGNRAIFANSTPTWGPLVGSFEGSAYPFALKYSDGTYGVFPNLWYPIASRATNTYSSSSTPDERALYFSLDAPMRVSGAWLSVDLDGDADVVLYDTDGSTSLTSASLTSAFRGLTGQMLVWVTFDDAVDLAVGTGYRMSVKPTTTTSLSTYTITVATNAHFGALGGGTGMYLSTRTDAGSWTETTTSRPLAGLVVTGTEVGGGGGSSGAIPFIGGLHRLPWPFRMPQLEGS